MNKEAMEVMKQEAYQAPEAELLTLRTLPLLASLSAEGGLGEYEDDGEL